MGTRGFLVFRWKGRKVVVYNHFDSYPSSMGEELFRQLTDLLRRFKGDVRQASQCWGELVSTLVLTLSEEGSERHPFNIIHAFEDIENALHSQLPLVVSDEDDLDEWIEFVWTVDLDKGTLLMRAHEGAAEWSFLNLHRGGAFVDKWLEEAENEAYKDDGVLSQKPFIKAVEFAAAVEIQASARRFLEVSRGLRPGGVLARLAAKRFHRGCEFLKL